MQDRNLALEVVRITEAAALASARLMGRGDRKLAPPPQSRSGGKRVGFDLKTDYDVDVEKFLPTEGYPLYAPNANGNQQNMSTPKKKPFFMGLSVTKPLN